MSEVKGKVNDTKVRLALVKQKQGVEKTLVLSDIHSPFHREDTIIGIIKKHRNDITNIIIAGDLVDCGDISVFPSEVRSPLIDECVTTYKLLRRITRLAPHVTIHIIWGNHEYRFVRYLDKNDGKLNPFHSSNILHEIVNGFTHHDRLNRKKTIYPPLPDNVKVIDNWYIKHNDLMIAHPQNMSKVPLRVAIRTAEYFVKRGYNFNACFIGHTHKVGFTFDYYNKWIGEIGCLCWNMEYANSGNINYSNPQQYGYGLFTFENGKISVNKSRIYKLELEDKVNDWEEVISE